MPKFPSQMFCVVVYLFTFNLTGCEDPPRSPRALVLAVKPDATMSAELPTAPKMVQEVDLEPLHITGHATADTEPVLGVVWDESKDAACKIAGDFLVVPIHMEPSNTYLNCGDQSDALYIMKLKNCSQQKIVFTTFTFTVTLSSKQEEVLKSDLANEFTHFELHVDNDHTNYINTFESVDNKKGIVAFPETIIEVGAGEEQFCRLKVVRPCSNNSNPLEFNLDLTGASASTFVEEGVEGTLVNGAVFDRPDRQITLVSRK